MTLCNNAGSSAPRKNKTLPTEIWLDILSLCTFTPNYLDVRPTDHFRLGYTEEETKATVRCRHAVILVCKEFYTLAKRFLYEFLVITRMRQLEALRWSINNFPDDEDYPDPALWVRRFDFSVTDPNAALADEANATSFQQAHLVWMYDEVYRFARQCPNLTHFSCHLPMHFNDINYDLDVVQYDQTFQTFVWGGGLRMPLAFIQLPSYRYLHILRLDNIDDMEIGTANMVPDMPNLHTLQAPISILFTVFPTIALPSLSVVILDRSLTYPASSQFRPHDFFAAHGSKIRTLSCAADFPLIIGHLTASGSCPHLTALTLNARFIDQIPPRVSGRLTHLGITADASLLNTPMNQWQTLWDYACDTVVGSFGHAFHELVVFRVVNREMARKLKECNSYGLRLWERRFRSNGIRMEDESGEILLAPIL